MCACDPWAPCESCSALARLRAKLTRTRPEGEGDVTFTRTDGLKVTIENVRVDSVGPSAESKGVIGVEYFGSDKVTHVPFVESWEFTY